VCFCCAQASRQVDAGKLQKQDFEKICNDLYIVTSKTPFTKKAFLQGRDPDDLKADQAEWRAGIPVSGEDGPWNSLLWRLLPHERASYSSDWDDETIKRLSGSPFPYSTAKMTTMLSITPMTYM
jgi:hypothetical protein